MGNDREPRSDYRVARIGAATATAGVIVFLCAADVAVPGYQLDASTLVVLCFVLLSLLGLEARDILRGK